MFVHHEDVRRGARVWEPRHLSERDDASLWKIVLNVAPTAFAHSPVKVVLINDIGQELVVNKSRDRTVTLTAPASELLLLAFGRTAVQIVTDGDPDDVAAVLGTDRSV